MTTPFEKLQEEFPIFQIKNKKGYTQSITTVDGETIDIPPNSTHPVRSSELSHVPDMQRFVLVVPKFKDLIRLGLFEQASETGQDNTQEAE